MESNPNGRVDVGLMRAVQARGCAARETLRALTLFHICVAIKSSPYRAGCSDNGAQRAPKQLLLFAPCLFFFERCRFILLSDPPLLSDTRLPPPDVR